MEKMEVSINATSEGTTLTSKAGKHQMVFDAKAEMGGGDKGPNPMEGLLSGLAACENITAITLAKEMNFDLQNIDFKITGIIDPRGLMGDSNVRTYFETIDIEATVTTTETEERIKELQKAVEASCPTYGMFAAANIDMNDNWIKA